MLHGNRTAEVEREKRVLMYLNQTVIKQTGFLILKDKQANTRSSFLAGELHQLIN